MLGIFFYWNCWVGLFFLSFCSIYFLFEYIEFGECDKSFKFFRLWHRWCHTSLHILHGNIMFVWHMIWISEFLLIVFRNPVDILLSLTPCLLHLYLSILIKNAIAYLNWILYKIACIIFLCNRVAQNIKVVNAYLPGLNFENWFGKMILRFDKKID